MIMGTITLDSLTRSALNIQSCLFILYFVIGTSLCACFYNRFLHPLRAYPGSLFASLTDLYKLHAL